jgi:hypothetical protein
LCSARCRALQGQDKGREQMIIDTHALRQQIWRAEKLYKDFIEYAKSIGCKITEPDEIVCNDEQARKLSNWWMENHDRGNTTQYLRNVRSR